MTVRSVPTQVLTFLPSLPIAPCFVSDRASPPGRKGLSGFGSTFFSRRLGLRRRTPISLARSQHGPGDPGVLGRLRQHGDRFKPNALLIEMAKKGETFYGRFGEKPKAA